MITIRNISIDYQRILMILSTVLVFGILLKIPDKRPYVAIETFLLSFTLLFSIIYMASIKERDIKLSPTLSFFLLYLFFYNFIIVFVRPLEVDISIFDSLLFSIQEFRVSTLGYFLPLIFIPLVLHERDNIYRYVILLAKISIVYTFFEQFVSSVGFREFFELLYTNSGVVSSNQIGAKSLGLYRIWGLIGSPQLLGVFHIITGLFLLCRKEYLWTFLSFIGVILSTSKTAYLILIIILFLYLLVNKKYFYLVLSSLILLIIGTFLFEFNRFLVDQMSSDYQPVQNFVQSIQGYFLLLANELDYETGNIYGQGAVYINETGPLSRVVQYFSENPLNLFFGKGITYSFLSSEQLSYTNFYDHDLKANDQLFKGLSSDFYLLTYFEQYGIFGLMLLFIIFFIIPIYKMFNDHSFVLYIPIVFFLSMLHYAPQISKLMMFFVSFAVWMIYSSIYKNSKNMC
tara:strand:- start:9897 stop:11270 length:1374 start_codon:yes stop_codon:yes gene_type:complete